MRSDLGNQSREFSFSRVDYEDIRNLVFNKATSNSQFKNAETFM